MSLACVTFQACSFNHSDGAMNAKASSRATFWCCTSTSFASYRSRNSRMMLRATGRDQTFQREPLQRPTSLLEKVLA